MQFKHSPYYCHLKELLDLFVGISAVLYMHLIQQ